jgi:hypothetical protein
MEYGYLGPEAELLSAMVAFFTKVGLTAEEWGLKLIHELLSPRYSQN